MRTETTPFDKLMAAVDRWPDDLTGGLRSADGDLALVVTYRGVEYAEPLDDIDDRDRAAGALAHRIVRDRELHDHEETHR